ncbi:hypothetical protein F6X51_17350 [Methylobacterium planeticum]|uniref:Uncharacterized protein n=1 Tax=Methylobacterium planeticum TaxID=2615211 RepID=A0A6N6MQ92_9HYPH|nr:hypothetical protein F6X51_17350 [Methylobacterium planeticum]
MPKIVMFALALALAAGAFWSVVLTDPPKSEAATATAKTAASERSELASADQCVTFGICP